VRDGREDRGVFVVDVDVCVAVGGIWESVWEMGGWVLAVEREVCGGGECDCDCDCGCGCGCGVESPVLREGGEGGVVLCALPLLLLLRRREGDVRCERETVIVLINDLRG